ncbi:MAG: zinc-binding dehydrogenase [Acidimicrobiales bacterium]
MRAGPLLALPVAGPAGARAAGARATGGVVSGMQALVFHHQLAREAAAKIGGTIDKRSFVSRFAPVSLDDVAEPTIPGPGWVTCDTLVSGLCGSDAKQILLNGSFDNPLTALLSFPHVLGHEAVARRTDTGERVVLNPWLSCGPRGIDPPCSACRDGRYPWCRNFTHGLIPPALHIGNCAGAAGAHAERFSAHEGQLFPVPADVPDEVAVLADPASVSLRTILLQPPSPGRPVLVYGSGTLAFAAIAIVRHLYPDIEVWAATRSGPRAAMAKHMGAHATLPSEPDSLVRAVADRIGAATLVPWSGREWLQDGPAVVYDTIGSIETVETSLRLLDTGGTLVVSGVEPPGRFEWTPLYFKELRMIGSNAFGIEEVGGVRKHAFEHYFDWVAAGLDLSPLVTHRFRLAQWDQAVLTAAEARKTGAIKVVLRP